MLTEKADHKEIELKEAQNYYLVLYRYKQGVWCSYGNMTDSEHNAQINYNAILDNSIESESEKMEFKIIEIKLPY